MKETVAARASGSDLFVGLILCGDSRTKVVNPMIWTGGCKEGYMIVHGIDLASIIDLQ
jgi:hypothetical protein